MSSLRGYGDGTGVIWISSRADEKELRTEYVDRRRVVSIDDGRPAANSRSANALAFSESFERSTRSFNATNAMAIPLVDAFLILRHRETLSELTLTFVQFTSRWTGELFNSLSRMVRR